MDPASRSAAVYYRLPSSLQNLAVSAVGLKLKRVRFGRAFEEKLALLRTSDTWTRERIRAHQDTEVARLAEHAYRTTRYYRRVFDERGLEPGDIRGISDLPKLPVLTKQDIRSNFDDLLSTAVDRSRLQGIRTSGSTGAPLALVTTREALAFKWAVWWRHRERFGVHRGAAHVKFVTKPVVRPTRRRPPYWRWNLAERRQAVIPMQQVVPTKVAAITAFLDEHPFEFYSGYPSILHSLASIATESDITLSNGPRITFSGAERMFADQQADIERFTGGAVSQVYGFNEGAGNAAMCEESHLHEDFEFGYLECVDSELDATTGLTRGRVIATGFSNLALPLIRYDVGDAGIWQPDDYRCPCGRGTRVLDSIVGRWEDYVVTPDGHRARRLGEIFLHMPGIRRFQLVQSSPDAVLLRLEVRPGFAAEHEDLLRRRVATWISPSLSVGFEYVDVIEPSAGGKYQRIVNTIGRSDHTP